MAKRHAGKRKGSANTNRYQQTNNQADITFLNILRWAKPFKKAETCAHNKFYKFDKNFLIMGLFNTLKDDSEVLILHSTIIILKLLTDLLNKPT